MWNGKNALCANRVHISLCHRLNLGNLWFKSVCEPVLKSLFLFPTCVLGFEYVPLLAWLKSHCWFANQVKGKFETHLGEFIVFVWCSGKGCWSYIGVRLRLNPLCRRGSHVLEPILGSVNYEAAWRQFLVYKNCGIARQTPCHLQNPGFHSG